MTHRRSGNPDRASDSGKGTGEAAPRRAGLSGSWGLPAAIFPDVLGEAYPLGTAVRDRPRLGSARRMRTVGERGPEEIAKFSDH